MKTLSLWIAIVLFSALSATALDIPLSGATDSGGGSGMRLGYVDMDRIFQVYPQTQAAKEDYSKQLKKKREQLAEKEKELDDIESRLSVLESTVKQGSGDAAVDPANTAGDPLANVSQSIQNMKKDLEDKKIALEDLRKQSKTELAAFERQQSQLILGKIYGALKDVAAEEQVSVVVDKNSILYGDASIDLTEKLQQRVRGY